MRELGAFGSRLLKYEGAGGRPSTKFQASGRMIAILLSIISYDVWFYISHVVLHMHSMYKYHALHHQTIEPNYIDTYEGHIVEHVFQGVGVFFPCIVYTYTAQDIVLTLLFLNIRGMMRHDARFVFLIGNHHLLHHRYSNYNFGEYWMDRLLGTAYPNAKEYRHGLLYT